MSHNRYHLAGVAGVGMSALAQVLAGQGSEVSGSDRFLDRGEPVDVFGKLELAGVRLVPQDGRGVTRDVTALVVSTAIEADNPEMLEARRIGVPILHRAELLARLTEDKRMIAVTGTSGKSTVTAMTGWILEQAGWDPVVVNGAPLVDWASENRIGNVRCGASDIWVVETDESDRSLLYFSPEYAVITNASQDHFDLAETRRLFAEFSTRVAKDVVSGLDDPLFMRDFEPELSAGGSRFLLGGTEILLRVPGRHNAENALLAAVLCGRVGIDLEGIAGALATFRGVCRRLETVGTAGCVTVIDDYGHNPAKIRAAWTAVAPYHNRVLAVWRPHGYGPLAAMMGALTGVFSELMDGDDRLWVLPVYDAGGTASRTVNSEMLAQALAGLGFHAEAVAGYDELAEAVTGEARAGDVVLTMGARDPELPLFARRMACRMAERIPPHVSA